MPDDTLRMVAEVQDRFSAPLRSLQAHIAAIKSGPGIPAMAKDFEGVRGGVARTVQEIRSGLHPALSSIGVASLGATTALGGVALAVGTFVTGAADAKRFASEIGVSTDKLRELQNLGQRFGIDTSQMQGSLRQFRDSMNDFQKRGQVYVDLMSRYSETLGKPIAAAKSMDEAAEVAIRGLAKIENSAERARVAAMLFGRDIFAGVKPDELNRAIDEVRRNLATMPQGAAEAAETLRQRVHTLRENLETLQVRGFAPLVPAIDGFVKGLSSIGAVNADNAQLRALMADIETWLRDTDWTKAGKDFGESFLSGLGEVRSSLRALDETIQGIMRFSDRVGGLLGGQDKWKPDPNGPALQARPGGLADRLTRQLPPVSDLFKGEAAAALPTPPARPELTAPTPISPDPRLQEEIARLRAERGSLQEDMPRVHARGDEATATEARRRLEELDAQIRRLNEERPVADPVVPVPPARPALDEERSVPVRPVLPAAPLPLAVQPVPVPVPAPVPKLPTASPPALSDAQVAPPARRFLPDPPAAERPLPRVDVVAPPIIVAPEPKVVVQPAAPERIPPPAVPVPPPMVPVVRAGEPPRPTVVAPQPRFDGDIARLRDERRTLQSDMPGLQARGDEAGAAQARRRLDDLNQRIRELTEEMRRQREQGGATVQQQSFEGGAFGSAAIQKASLPSFAGGAWRRPAQSPAGGDEGEPAPVRRPQVEPPPQTSQPAPDVSREAGQAHQSLMDGVRRYREALPAPLKGLVDQLEGSGGGAASGALPGMLRRYRDALPGPLKGLVDQAEGLGSGDAGSLLRRYQGALPGPLKGMVDQLERQGGAVAMPNIMRRHQDAMPRSMRGMVDRFQGDGRSETRVMPRVPRPTVERAAQSEIRVPNYAEPRAASEGGQPRVPASVGMMRAAREAHGREGGVGTDPLIDLIRRKEGTSGDKGFNTSLAHGALLPGGRDTTLTDKSFREIYDIQTGMLRHPANRWNSSAIGAGQFVRNTLFKDGRGRGTPDNPGTGSVMREMGIKPDQKFDPQTQLAMMDHLIRRRGRNSAGLGNEWEGLKRFSNQGEILTAYDQRQKVVSDRLSPRSKCLKAGQIDPALRCPNLQLMF